MDKCLQDFIGDVAYNSRVVLERLGPLTQINTLYAGTPDYDTRITQSEIDEVPLFLDAQLTATDVADACYALEQIRAAMNNAIAALTVLGHLNT
jgi:hypothetical protein